MKYVHVNRELPSLRANSSYRLIFVTAALSRRRSRICRPDVAEIVSEKRLRVSPRSR
jgi:hypothetical protein